MRIFATEASGFIGGSVAATLAREGATVRGLIRERRKEEAVSRCGVEPVFGALDDADLLAHEARAADAVINAASSDHRAAVDTLIAALAGSGKPLIHTSGSSIIADEANGEPSDQVFEDDTPFIPEPDKLARVKLDRVVREAPGVQGIVLCNSMIYGDFLGPPARSVQLPRLIDEALDSGVAHHVGRGLNLWSHVHIADVTALYLLALRDYAAGTFAFVESGESRFIDLAAAIAAAFQLGGPESMSIDDAIGRWGCEPAVFALGSNSRVRTVIAKANGWRPSGPGPDEWIRSLPTG